MLPRSPSVPLNIASCYAPVPPSTLNSVRYGQCRTLKGASKQSTRAWHCCLLLILRRHDTLLLKSEADMGSRFVLVLHSHLPYVLGKGRWPFGEEWLHEVVLETYLPLLEGLECLAHDDIPPPIALGLTPILMEPVSYTHLRAHETRHDL